MFLIDDKVELSNDKLVQIIQQFMTSDRPRLQRWYNYFLGKQDIMRKEAENQFKPCNRIVNNYCSTITTAYNGYLTGKDITYSSDNNIDEIMDILNYNDVGEEDNHLLKDALIFGCGYEICYIDKDGKQRMKVLDPRECIPVYSSGLDEDLRAVIRLYLIDNLDMTNYYIDVYTAEKTSHYKSEAGFATITFISEEPNFYNQVPITVFPLNHERESVFNRIMGLQDAYNTLISSSVDDFQAFADAYLVVNGIELTQEQAESIRENRIFNFYGDKEGKVEYLTKDIKTTQIENLLEKIDEKIHIVANCPNFNDEAFGTASGIAMKYKLLGFENAAGDVEKAMTKALQRRIELFCSILSITTGDEMWRDIKIVFHRNLPIDITELANEVNSLRGLVSTRTLLAQLPFIDNVDAEMGLVEEENQKNAELYNFKLEQAEPEDEE